MFKGKNIILGVTSSIAAYKSANVASALVKKGCNVNVLMTENATNFINPLTFEELTKHKCIIDTFDRNVQYNVAHISLAVSADAFIIAPASANVIGKIANGIADDMLTTTVMACKCPVIISPAIGGLPDMLTWVLCVVFTLLWARIAAVFANRAQPKTLNSATGVVLVVLGLALMGFQLLA